LHLSGKAQQALLAESGKLGGASVPTEVGPQNTAATEISIKRSFTDTFRLVMFICTGLAWASALAAAILIEPRLHQGTDGMQT